MTDLETAALAWIAPYTEAHHLRRTRDWVLELDPGAGAALRLAAMTHDMERHVPGGPVLDKAGGRWDDPDYLFAHSTRSADVVGAWLADQPGAADEELRLETRRLIQLHELGGVRGADVLQAADSLSFLETLGEATAGWVRDGLCSPASAEVKLRWMYERVRVERARTLAAPMLDAALRLIPRQAVAP